MATTQLRITLRVLALVLIVGISLSASESVPSIVEAAHRGDLEAVRSLIRARADVNKPAVDGTTALHWAVRGNNLEMVDVLVKAGANVKAVNRYGIAPLTFAAENGSARVVDMLLKAGASANTTTAS